ncbi:hypothetical protein ABG768_000017 [Culter alburnus]|uniref:RING-type domain-containing protein n=1 Tax=Culter alburnus TaxID=194366 RepID=A0AAW2B319_CULAL
MKANQSSGQNDLYDIKLKYVRRKDDITSDEDLTILRVEMSCGHAASPESVSGWCRSLLDQGQYKFYCPAKSDGIECEKEWSYLEVRKAAELSDEDQAYFEEKMARLAAEAEYCEFKSCPSCESYVERKDLTNICVKCNFCTAVKKKTYQFCWQCMREWKGTTAHSVHCSYEDCINPVDKLAECNTIKLSSVDNVECPSIRACPTCGLLVEHKGNACKNLKCKRCKVEFCFLCLKLKSICNPEHEHYNVCSVAQRQTEIPVWNRKTGPHL